MMVFGGTFDPPHLAHVRLAALAAQERRCERILFVPAAISPHKSRRPIASNEHRIAMLALATADLPGARICTIELERSGPSYTIDTLRELHRQFAEQGDVCPPPPPQLPPPPIGAKRTKKIIKGARGAGRAGAPTGIGDQTVKLSQVGGGTFHLLIGCDQALEFQRWKNWRGILKLATPAVMLRPPWNEQSFADALAKSFTKAQAGRWMEWVLRLPRMDISATDIRTRLAKGDDAALEGRLDPTVLEYIRTNKLYA